MATRNLKKKPEKNRRFFQKKRRNFEKKPEETGTFAIEGVKNYQLSKFNECYDIKVLLYTFRYTIQIQILIYAHTENYVLQLYKVNYT